MLSRSRHKCWLATKLQVVHRLVRPMLAQAERIAPDMSSFALATTLSALGRLKLAPPGLMDALVAAATSLAPSFDAKVGLPRPHGI